MPSARPAIAAAGRNCSCTSDDCHSCAATGVRTLVTKVHSHSAAQVAISDHRRAWLRQLHVQYRTSDRQHAGGVRCEWAVQRTHCNMTVVIVAFTTNIRNAAVHAFVHANARRNTLTHVTSSARCANQRTRPQTQIIYNVRVLPLISNAASEALVTRDFALRCGGNMP